MGWLWPSWLSWSPWSHVPLGKCLYEVVKIFQIWPWDFTAAQSCLGFHRAMENEFTVLVYTWGPQHIPDPTALSWDPRVLVLQSPQTW